MGYGSLPGPTDSIIIAPQICYCEEHMSEIDEYINLMDGMMLITQYALEDEDILSVAYRKKNGYDIPEEYDLENDDMPEKEKPGVPHINEAFAQLSPLCCQLSESALDKVKDGEQPQT